ncbi:hypothetical protein N789_03870 [Arenimonas oryziterrae DSM 21050 = YC6267]|uniref:cyclic-guanylate-specific phosphodiesterase n=1 Tax=Arenimonas oryziterrae DSM 21050 = YC6267 TaxID=1121015 RepID=A0A091APX5_9GAMM|nr:hypothetical protein N789_03870 [Arenimonas oryziterrae DSM 21050 = YC6267]
MRPLRHAEIGSQAILDALTAHIALLDAEGVITSVNQAWRDFGDANRRHSPGHEVGTNYLDICDEAEGDDALLARHAAAGIRAVLSGEAPHYSLEYPCHSPAMQRWFVLTVTPIGPEQPAGVVVMHVDISERMRIAEVLSRQQTELRVLFDLMPAMVWFKDTQNTILRINQFAAAAAGRAVCEIEGRSAAEIYPNESDAFYADDLEVIASGRPKLGIVQTLTGEDGREHVLQLDKVPYFDDQRQVIGIAVLARDITEQRRAMQLLRESERRFSDMLGNMHLASVTLDREARITYCNPYLLRLTGWTLAEVLGRDWFETFMPAELGDRKPTFAALLENAPEAWHVENEMYTRTRERRLLRWNNCVLRSETGEVVGVSSIGEDITEQRQAEAAVAQAAERLRQSEGLKAAILQSSLDCIIAIDHEGHIVEFNSAAETTFGYTRAQALGQPMDELIVPLRFRDAHRRGMAHYLATGEGPVLGKRIELDAMRADGSEFPMELTIAPIGETATPMFTGFIRDITQRREAERRLQRLNRVYAVLSGINALTVRVHERSELFRDACRIAVELGQYSVAWIGLVDGRQRQVIPAASAGTSASFLADNYDSFPLREDATGANTAVAQAVRQRRTIVSNELRNDSRVMLAHEPFAAGAHSRIVLPLLVNGEAVGVLVLYAAGAGFFDSEELALLTGLADDIAFAIGHIERGERLAYLARYDELTGLGNQASFLERLQQKIHATGDSEVKTAVFVVDIERFKEINDALGRKTGDEVLRQLAARFGRLDGEGIHRFARISGDRFAIYAPGMGNVEQVGRYVEERMAKVFSPSFHVGGNELHVSIKLGIAIYPDDGSDADEVLRHAEAALKKAKATGNRYLFFAHKMTERVAERLSLEGRLRQALERNEFVLYYQPKINLVNGALTGGEALIRWNDPQTGLVPPGLFIPVLEETGLIFDVGRWAMHKAIEDYLRWLNAGLASVRIAVNVSPLQLRSRSFVEEVRQALSVDPRAAAGLELEITESLVMEDVAHNIAILQAVRDMGVTIAVDDFGTGFSSLSYLSKLPMDTLKIDRMFVNDMTATPQGEALVSTIVNMAHSFQHKVVAEGVETEAQRQILRRLGCDEMQGFLVSRPLPGDTFASSFLLAPSGH